MDPEFRESESSGQPRQMNKITIFRFHNLRSRDQKHPSLKSSGKGYRRGRWIQINSKFSGFGLSFECVFSSVLSCVSSSWMFTDVNWFCMVPRWEFTLRLWTYFQNMAQPKNKFDWFGMQSKVHDLNVLIYLIQVHGVILGSIILLP